MATEEEITQTWEYIQLREEEYRHLREQVSRLTLRLTICKNSVEQLGQYKDSLERQLVLAQEERKQALLQMRGTIPPSVQMQADNMTMRRLLEQVTDFDFSPHGPIPVADLVALLRTYLATHP